jgi:hypothetical protein
MNGSIAKNVELTKWLYWLKCHVFGILPLGNIARMSRIWNFTTL